MKANNSWLGSWFLIKTFDNLDKCDIAEVYRILGEDEESMAPEV
jgi:hypothetical protein